LRASVKRKSAFDAESPETSIRPYALKIEPKLNLKSAAATTKVRLHPEGALGC
jgi:hypothetical protein